MIHVTAYQVRNGVHYDLVKISEIIEESQLPQLQTKYRQKLKSVKTEKGGKFRYNPDIDFVYIKVNNRDVKIHYNEKTGFVCSSVNTKPKVQQGRPNEARHEIFTPTTKTIKELIRY